MIDDLELRRRLHAAAATPAGPRRDDLAAADAVIDRRRTERWHRAAAVAVVACVALVVVVVPVLLGGAGRSGDEGGGDAAGGHSFPLPPRGSLADDPDYLAAVRELDWPNRPVPDSADRQVVFAGETPAGRVALVVGPAEGQLFGQWYTGPAAAAPQDLVPDSSYLTVDPAESTALAVGQPGSGVDGGGGALIVIAQPGDQVLVSPRAEIATDGTVGRDYQPVDTVDGVAVVALDAVVPGADGARYRVVHDGVVSESRGVFPAFGAGEVFDPPDLVPLRPGGDPDPAPEAIDQALRQVSGPTGLGEETLDPVLLWSGVVPGPDGGDADVVVLALTLPSGAVATSTAFADMAADGSGTAGGCGVGTHPAGTAVADVVAAAACSVPGTSNAAELVSYVVTAPPGHARVELLRSGGAPGAAQTLEDGAAVVRDVESASTARVTGPGLPDREEPITRITDALGEGE
ncbi:hypothetical protein [uncultured Modestobacter sp.]|uniref:hypothetical protein n=1 Tax=uncultured Modestobacter sp. TaxID=380048 RepID=UPI00260B3609|nr:hypothetical protein [uncultured Modestobacter sp.]